MATSWQNSSSNASFRFSDLRIFTATSWPTYMPRCLAEKKRQYRAKSGYWQEKQWCILYSKTIRHNLLTNPHTIQMQLFPLSSVILYLFPYLEIWLEQLVLSLRMILNEKNQTMNPTRIKVIRCQYTYWYLSVSLIQFVVYSNKSLIRITRKQLVLIGVKPSSDSNTKVKQTTVTKHV